MIISLLLKSIILDMYDEIIYDPLIGKIYSKISNTYLQLEVLEIRPYFYFTLNFEKYNYEKYYFPETKIFQTKIKNKIYNIILNLNIDLLSSDEFIPKKVLTAIAHYCAIIQINKLIKKQDYILNPDDVSDFINLREKNYMEIITPWDIFPLNKFISIENKFYFSDNNQIYGLFHKENKISEITSRNKIYFQRKGGIIETDNLGILQQKYFSQSKNIVILPNNLSNLWSDSDSYIITHEDLMTLSKKKIYFLNKIAWDKIIIHELHLKILPYIKIFCDGINCKIVWVLNALPLQFYFNKSKLKLKDLFTLSNLWINLSDASKKTYKKEIIRMIKMDFDKYYAKLSYPNKIGKEIKIKFNQFEKIIKEQLHNVFDIWRNNLTNDKNNIYSSTDQKQSNWLEKRIFNSALMLILSIGTSNENSQKINKHVKKVIKKLESFDYEMQSLQNKYKKSLHIDEDFFDMIINKNQSQLTNYQRYAKTQKNTDENLQCPICFGSEAGENLVFSKLICGHHICLECMISSITQKNECPVCREDITIDKIFIDQQTIKDYHSEFKKYLLNLDNSTLIITDLDALEQLNCNPDNKINIMYNKIDDILEKLPKVTINPKQILIMTFSPEMDPILSNLIGYFNSVNDKISFRKIIFQ